MARYSWRSFSLSSTSFAVPSNIAKKVIDDLLEYGAVQEAILGINIDGRDSDIDGVKIAAVNDQGGAKKGGLKSGDIIKKINDVKISKFSDLRGQLTAKRPGDFVNITLDRDGEFIIKKIKLGKKIKLILAKSFGWELKDLSKKELKAKSIENGVKIVNSSDSRNDLSGFIITKINDAKVNNAGDTAKLIDSLSSNRYSYNIIEMINLKGERERFRF